MPGRRGVRACAARRVRKYDREVLRGSESLGWVGDGRSESSLEGAAHPLRMNAHHGHVQGWLSRAGGVTRTGSEAVSHCSYTWVMISDGRLRAQAP